jgi:hypothetical protein
MCNKQGAEKPPIAGRKPILESTKTIGLYLSGAETVLKEEDKRCVRHGAATLVYFSN